jgi:hypothetical protein
MGTLLLNMDEFFFLNEFTMNFWNHDIEFVMKI